MRFERVWQKYLIVSNFHLNLMILYLTASSFVFSNIFPHFCPLKDFPVLSFSNLSAYHLINSQVKIIIWPLCIKMFISSDIAYSKLQISWALLWYFLLKWSWYFTSGFYFYNQVWFYICSRVYMFDFCGIQVLQLLKVSCFCV